MAPATYEHRRIVKSAEIDRLGHVNNLAYLNWMLEAALEHSAVLGWPAERYEQLGCGWVVRSHEITYLQSAFENDPIVVRTWVDDMSHVSSTRRFEIVRTSDNRRLAKATTKWAFVDFATLALKRIPPEVWQAYEVVRDRDRAAQAD